jgi:hypothetical protein
MADSEDELVGPEAFAASEAEEDEGNEYEVSEQEDEAAANDDEAGVSAPPDEDDEEQAAGTPARSAKGKAPSATPEKRKERYIFANRAVWAIPVSDGTAPGIVRDREQSFEVDSLEELHELTGSVKNWPKPMDIHPLSIYVVRGRFTEADDLEAEGGESPYAWYMRFSIRGKQDSPENLILRHMPRAVVRDTLEHFARMPNLNQSSLITVYQPRDDNNKPLPMALNNFKKAPHIRIEQKAKRIAKKAEDAAVPAGFEDYDAAASPAAAKKTKAKKPPEESPKPVAPPEPAKKPPAKKTAGTMHQFAKPVKQTAASSSAPAAKEAAAPAPAPAAAPVAAPVAGPVAGPSAKRSTGFDETTQLNAKRVCTATFDDKEKVHLIWSGNTLHVLEL